LRLSRLSIVVIAACAAVIAVAVTHGRPTAPVDAAASAMPGGPLKPGSGPWIEARRTVRHVLCDDLSAWALADGRVVMSCPQDAGDPRWLLAYPGETEARDIDRRLGESLLFRGH
jgi:hypothetical protein